MKSPKNVCGWGGSAPDPAVGAYDAPPDLLVGCGGGHPFPHPFLHPKPLTAVVGRLQGHEGKMDIGQWTPPIFETWLRPWPRPTFADPDPYTSVVYSDTLQSVIRPLLAYSLICSVIVI